MSSVCFIFCSSVIQCHLLLLSLTFPSSWSWVPSASFSVLCLSCWTAPLQIPETITFPLNTLSYFWNDFFIMNTLCTCHTWNDYFHDEHTMNTSQTWNNLSITPNVTKQEKVSKKRMRWDFNFLKSVLNFEGSTAQGHLRVLHYRSSNLT